MTVANALRIACLQLSATAVLADNLKTIDAMVRQAAADGAELIALPENTVGMADTPAERAALIYKESEHPALPFFCHLARETQTTLALGSLWIQDETSSSSPLKAFNRSYIITPDGVVAARYNKIHLFDATVAGDRAYQESAHFSAGSAITLASLPFATLGLSICYDVRFAYLYRALAQRGASLLLVPAAFIHATGSLHWHTLLRARAIETGSYVIAAGQCGWHGNNRRTYGHSLIVDPTGHIIAEAGEEPTILSATIDLNLVNTTRAALPCLNHDRPIA